MIKKPGAFSDKYMSNTLSNRQSLGQYNRNHNKQNKNLNGTFEQYDSDLSNGIKNRITPPKCAYYDKPNTNTMTKLKQEHQVRQKQLNNQITKLRKQVFKMKQENKNLRTNNQDTICRYEQYLKEIKQEMMQAQQERNDLKQKNIQYRDYLQYAILWLIQIFSMGEDPSKKLNLQKYMNRDKFSQLFQKLTPIVQQLHIEEQLRRLCSKNSQQTSVQDYLLLQNNDFSIQSSMEQANMQPQLPTLLDTFDFRKGYEQQTDNNDKGIVRKLFESTDKDSFEQIEGEEQNNLHMKSINEYFFKEKNQHKQSAKIQKVYQPDEIIKITKDYNPSQEDYLKLNKDTEIKLLRKVGDKLWIVQVGDQIGYIENQCLI